MALLLLCTVPSGEEEVVRVRSELSSRLRLPAFRASRSMRPAVVHLNRPVGQDAARLIYVGSGKNDPQQRPSIWYNPFFFVCGSEAEANDRFSTWLCTRMDLELFLRPLLGMALLCDCHRGLGCHCNILLRVLDRVFPPPGNCQPHFGFVETAPSLEPFIRPQVDFRFEKLRVEAQSDSDDSGTEVQVVTPLSKPDEINRVDETRRGSFNSTSFGRERPAWPKSWLALIASIRLLNVMCFWEICSGVAGLTTAFEAAGWSVGPPIDIVYCQDFDLLNQIFLGLCLGLIFERRIRMLHVGPPCSSFSMACNGCLATMMRSLEFPHGLPVLSAIRREKVVLGNALAEVAVKLCQAQSLASGLWTWEQPWTSLMWIYPPVVAFMAKYCEARAYVDVCMFGAPWKKPTGLAANFEKILELVRYCACTKPHQILRGQGPGGKAWTAIASPYWPAFATEWANTCSFCKPCPDELVASASHLMGFGIAPDDISIEELLSEANFIPSAGTSIATSAIRVAAGLQPPGRRMPTLMPEGLGADEHLRVALNLQHPVARNVVLKPHIHHALDNQHSNPDDLVSYRRMVLDIVMRLAQLLVVANNCILSCVHCSLRPVLAQKNLAFMREICFVVQCPDFAAVLDLVWGLPMAGWARHSPNLVQKVSSVPRPLDVSLEGVAEHNLKVLASVRSSGDSDADLLAWAKCQKEFESGGLLGPWESLGCIPYKDF